MANYYGTARSNYFHVKDVEALAKTLEGIDITISPKNEENPDSPVCLLSDEEGGWPSFRYDEETDECEDFNLPEEIAKHLVDGEVAILMEAGAEKLRYINGCAIAVNAAGVTRKVHLYDIYELAEELTDHPENITRCQY